MALPEKLLENIDRVNRNSLWGSSDSSKKSHWVGWQKVMKPKMDGGLGLQSAKGKNLALLAKLNWRYHMEKHSIWVKVLKRKYCTTCKLNSNNKEKLPCSRVWKAMSKGEKVFNKGIRWILRRNSTLSLWYDNWCCQGSLWAIIQGPLTEAEENLRIADVDGSGYGEWD